MTKWIHCSTQIHLSGLNSTLEEYEDREWELAALTVLPTPSGTQGQDHLLLAVFKKPSCLNLD